MIKKLDILVLKAFTGPFIATFFLTLFVLILQFFWLWIDDFVGKGLDALTFIKLTIYLSATLIPLALPLAVLLSSIMTFGNLGETFELVAIKSAGIGLLRFMRPLMITAILLSGLAFIFANNLIPVANLKMRTLHHDIVNKKPAFELREGVFYNSLPGYSIKVSKKINDSTLKDVIIYEAATSSEELQDNMIVAKDGIMRVTKNQRYLEFTLKDGWRYQERARRGNPGSSEFIRLGFKEYKKVIDLKALAFDSSSESAFKDRVEMLSIRQLNHAIDSLEKLSRSYQEKVERDMRIYLPFSKYLDSGWKAVKVPPVKTASIDSIIPDSARRSVVQQSYATTSSIRSSLQVAAIEYKSKQTSLRSYLQEWHQKFTMSVAVFVLFLIGAPLGSIVRKGGIGTPVVFAVVFFVIFFLLNNFGRKFVGEGVLPPVLGMWMATIVLVPIGLFLVYKALNDSQLFNQEFYFRTFRGIRKVVGRLVPKKKTVVEPQPPAENEVASNDQ